MKIRDLLKARKGPLFSFEFFPPKTPEGEEALFRTMEELKAFRPAFVSITYGAMGSTRDRSVLWAKRILDLGLNALAHLTVAGQSQEEVAGVLDRFVEAGVENILALRGDPPQGERVFRPHPQGFRYASELVAHILSLIHI